VCVLLLLHLCYSAACGRVASKRQTNLKTENVTDFNGKLHVKPRKICGRLISKMWILVTTGLANDTAANRRTTMLAGTD